MRRLPVYFLLDTSGSMYGEPIHALNNALSSMINSLRSDAQAIDSLWISIITFDREVNEVLPMTDLVNLQLPEIVCPQSGPTHTGKALEFLYERVPLEIRKGNENQKGDWRPILFLFTDGKPSDSALYRDMIPKIRSLNFATIVGCAAGPQSSNDMLKELTDNVIHLDTTDSQTLKTFFTWVSEAIESGNRSVGTTDELELPKPPDVIHQVF